MSRLRLGGRADAIVHLRKASEFLEAAQAALASDWSNAATSNAVTAGINAKDASVSPWRGVATLPRTIAPPSRS